MSLPSRGRIRLIRGVISTDDIIPGKYKHMFVDPGELAKHVFENNCPDLGARLSNDDVLIGDSIFGIGSSREQAPASLLAAGVAVVIAPRFGRIFYRNAWNVGLPLIEAFVPHDETEEGSYIDIDWERGSFMTAARTGRFFPPSPHLVAITRAGGLIAHLKANYANAVR
ncbi:hypothetical protein [Bradyrhizobium sp. SZCCHNRI20481]|uniref:LeuD/DmdB family oxidoreductase small subunit n=1 Tax=Bradyrhizobium sp. SZCCHNRI20481 TaxID=3057286 RepID=UPI002916A758|nr:hypothetical protein [Bradyrhizobium sp. SZCCHNRI20481]